MGKYDDLMEINWPMPTGHPPMSMDLRAKIFSPFAALRGYEEALEERRKITVPKVELTDDKKEQLDYVLSELETMLKDTQHPIVKIVYYDIEKGMNEGVYRQVTGMLSRLDFSAMVLQVVNQKILLKDIRDIEIESSIVVE